MNEPECLVCHCGGGHGSSPGVSVAVRLPDVGPILGWNLPWKVKVAQPAGVVDPFFIKVFRPVARCVLDRLTGLPLSSFPANVEKSRVSGKNFFTGWPSIPEGEPGTVITLSSAQQISWRL